MSLGALWGMACGPHLKDCVCGIWGAFPFLFSSVSVALIFKSHNKNVVTVTLSRAHSRGVRRGRRSQQTCARAEGEGLSLS